MKKAFLVCILTLIQFNVPPSETKRHRNYCTDIHAPPFLPLDTTKGVFGTWYLFEQYGITNATVCEVVHFYPGKTNTTFKKKLNTAMNNGTWVTQYQNGTITSGGQVTLDFIYANGSFTNPPLRIKYTVVGFKSHEYMIVFYCKKNASVPQIPILTRSLNPPKSVWDEVFGIISNSGLNFAWLDLNCRAPPSNASIILQFAEDKTDETNNTSSLTSLSYTEYYANLFNVSTPISDQVLYDEEILERNNHKLRSGFTKGTFF